MKREAELRLTIAIIAFATIPLMIDHLAYVILISLLGIYSLITGFIRLSRRKKS